MICVGKFGFIVSVISLQSLIFAQSKLLSTIDTLRIPKDHESIIIVGGGLAGLSAAIEAFNNEASVVLVDKEAGLGGNSAKATSGISAANTEAQIALKIEDSIEKFYLDTITAGDNKNDIPLVNTLVQQSKEAITFLTEIGGIDLSDVNLCGGHSVARLHWTPSRKEGRPTPIGLEIVNGLKKKLFALRNKNPERITVLLNTTVVGLVTWNEYITGVRYIGQDGKIEELNGKAVVLTTGGFANDHSEGSLLTEFANDEVAKLPTTNGPFSTGDGVKMARGMGAAIVDMDQIQVHPTSFVDQKSPDSGTKFLAAEALRGKGAILLNEKGRRFGNELSRRDHLTDRIRKNCAKDNNGWFIAYMLVNNAIADTFGRPAFNFYTNVKGFFTKLNSVEELAKYLNCEESAVRETLQNYNTLAQNYTTGKTVRDEFDKSVFPVIFDMNGPFYIAKITPAIHYTMGGLKIDEKAYVFSEFMGKPFSGLLAAGEVTGGVHGANRLAGNSLLECVVFGRIAGKSAAKISYSRDEL